MLATLVNMEQRAHQGGPPAGLDNELMGGALSAVRAQCNYLGVWPY